jgi:ABC-type lipoprotein export system ATPase subunit
VAPGPAGFRIDGRLWLEKDGETTRFYTARTLVIEPEVFCCDDPIAALGKTPLKLLINLSLA